MSILKERSQATPASLADFPGESFHKRGKRFLFAAIVRVEASEPLEVLICGGEHNRNEKPYIGITQLISEIRDAEYNLDPRSVAICQHSQLLSKHGTLLLREESESSLIAFFSSYI